MWGLKIWRKKMSKPVLRQLEEMGNMLEARKGQMDQLSLLITQQMKNYENTTLVLSHLSQEVINLKLRVIALEKEN